MLELQELVAGHFLSDESTIGDGDQIEAICRIFFQLSLMTA